MKIRDTIIRSIGSLVRAKSRTILTTSAIAVGAFSMTMAIAMGQGGGVYAQKLITANTQAHSLWIMKQQDSQATAGRPSVYTGTTILKFNKISVQPINQYDLDKVAAVDGIQRIEPVFMINNAFVTRPGQQRYQASLSVVRPGVDIVYVAGNGNNMADDQVILPDGYRMALGFPTAQSAIGAMIELTVMKGDQPSGIPKTFRYTIKGVSMLSSMSLALAPTSMLLTQHATQQLNEFVTDGTPAEGQFIAANAEVDPTQSLDVVKQRVINLGYLAQTPGDVYGALYQFVGVLQLVLFGFGMLAVMTAVFGIVNTQYISVLERVQEIGLMKALGMNRADVSWLFEIEAGLIGFVGSTVGALLALLIGIMLNPMIIQGLTLDPGTDLLQFSLIKMIGVILALTATSVIAGLLPARRAADLDPIEALRSDRL